jgi:hypothetical protein
VRNPNPFSCKPGFAARQPLCGCTDARIQRDDEVESLPPPPNSTKINECLHGRPIGSRSAQDHRSAREEAPSPRQTSGLFPTFARNCSSNPLALAVAVGRSQPPPSPGTDMAQKRADVHFWFALLSQCYLLKKQQLSSNARFSSQGASCISARGTAAVGRRAADFRAMC